MKAAVCYEIGKPLVVEEVDILPPEPGEVKVKLAATAVCHSDIHLFKGEIPGTLPVVGGHESAGYVDEIGEGVVGLEKGDPVVVSLLSSCGKCKYCLTGLSHLCNYKWPLDTESRMRNKKGETLMQAYRTGSFAEYTVVDKSQVVKIPEDMPMDRACMLACGVITGLGAVINRAKPEVLSSCAIIGCGGVGLNAVQGAAMCGAYPVIAVDISDSKLEAAKKFGATHTINSSKVDARKTVRGMTGGEGADYVFVTVGSAEVVQQGFAMSAPRGMTVMVGIPNSQDKVSFTPFFFIGGEKTLTGSFMGTTQLHTEIPKLVALYKAGVLKLDELITARYPIGDINKAIEMVEQGKALRNIITFE